MAKDAEVDNIDGSGDYENKTVKKLPLTSKNLNGAMGYITYNAKQVFTQLKQVFTKAPILQHFDLEYYLRIETDLLSYAIDGVLNQLTLDNLSQ